MRMCRVKVFYFTLFVVFLVLNGKTECEGLVGPPLLGPPLPPRPLCISQFALVNHVCSLLPFTPAPPYSPPIAPPPPDDDDDDDGGNDDNDDGHDHGNRRRHRHRHRHRHGHGHQETAIEQDCCRWLKDVDSECVCDLLVHLPSFLSRPVHQYTVVVDDSCNVTFQCRGRRIGI